MKRCTLVLAMVVVVSGGALCGDSPEQIPTPSAAEIEGFRSAAQASADDALLRIDDFPSGWVAEDPPLEDDIGEFDPSSPKCAELMNDLMLEEGASDLHTNNVVASAESKFQSDDGQQDIGTGVGVYASSEDASDAAAIFEQLFDLCGDDLAAAFEKELMTNTDPALELSNVHVALELSEANLGDWSRVSSLEFSYDLRSNEPPLALLGTVSIETTVSVTFIRIGRITGQLLETDAVTRYSMQEAAPPVSEERIDSAMKTALGALFVERMREAERSLPEQSH